MFISAIPAQITDLGLSNEFRSAYLKLSASLPDSLQATGSGVRQRILLDHEWWKKDNIWLSPFLRQVYQAIWEDRKMEVALQYDFGFQYSKVIEPYSLVNKIGHWFLISRVDRNFQVFDISRIVDCSIMDDVFERDMEFNLQAFWQEWRAQYEQEWYGYPVRLRISEKALKFFTERFQHEFAVLNDRDISKCDWREMIVQFANFTEARKEILAVGGAVEVLSPLALRLTIIDYAEQIINVYSANAHL